MGFYSFWKDQGDFRRTHATIFVLFSVVCVAIWCGFVFIVQQERTKEALSQGEQDVERIATRLSQGIAGLEKQMLSGTRGRPWVGADVLAPIGARGLDALGTEEFSCLDLDAARSMARSFSLVTLPKGHDEVLFRVRIEASEVFVVDAHQFCFAKLSPRYFQSLFPAERDEKDVAVFAIAAKYRNLFIQPKGFTGQPELVSSTDTLLLGPSQILSLVSKDEDATNPTFEFLNKVPSLTFPEGIGRAPVAGTNLELVTRWLPAGHVLQSFILPAPLIVASVVLFLLLFLHVSLRAKELYKPMSRVAETIRAALKLDRFNSYLPQSKNLEWNALTSSINALFENVEQTRQKYTVKVLEETQRNQALLKARNTLFSGGAISFSTEKESQYLSLQSSCYFSEMNECLVHYSQIGERLVIIVCSAPAAVTQLFLDTLVLHLARLPDGDLRAPFERWLNATRSAFGSSSLRIDGACFAVMSLLGDVLDCGGEAEIEVSQSAGAGTLLVLKNLAPAFKSSLARRSPDLAEGGVVARWKGPPHE